MNIYRETENLTSKIVKNIIKRVKNEWFMNIWARTPYVLNMWHAIHVFLIWCVPHIKFSIQTQHAWPNELKNPLNCSNWRILCLTTCKKSTSLLTSFLRYYRDIGNLLLWVIWAWAVMLINTGSLNLYEIWMFICMEKTKFIPPLFLKIMQKYCKVILGTLGMPDYDQQKRWIPSFLIFI